MKNAFKGHMLYGLNIMLLWIRCHGYDSGNRKK